MRRVSLRLSSGTVCERSMQLHTNTPSTLPPRGFQTQEYEHRCSGVQSLMRAQSIDVLCLTTHPDIYYLTGFLTPFWQSPTRPWYLLVPQSGKPVAVIPGIGEQCMQRTWVDDIRTWSSPDPHDDGVGLLVDTLIELAGSSPAVGVAMSRETYVRCCLNDQSAIRAALPNASWVDATPAIRPVRHIKSAAEIEKLRYICAVANKAFDRVPEIITTGMTTSEAFRNFKIACLQSGADDCAYLVGAASASGYHDIISPPDNHLIEAGDIMILDTGCNFDGYYCDFDRNFAFTQVDEATAGAHHRVWDATEAALDIIRPGVTGAELYQVMQDVMAGGRSELKPSSAGVGRLGHGLGVELTETPSIAAFDNTPLQVGMVMTLEPGYSYAPSKMMVHEENLVITETGFELLSCRAPRDIPVL